MNPISPIPVITAVFSQLSEEASSQTFTFSRNWIKSLIKEKQFHEILDQYDRQFLKYYDNEISVHNVDMGALSSRRKDLLILSKKVLSQKVIRLNINHRKRFINEACQIIGDYSDIVGLYLNGFFDLVSMKETKDISLEGQATINTLVDQICDEFQKHEHRIVTLETKIDNIRHESIQDLSFSDYYDYVNKQFTKKKSGDYEKLVGSYSDEEAYIAASIRYGYVNEYVLPFLEKWYKRDKYGIMLIYGEPGHGKTMLCHKAMVDFSKGSFLKDRAKNVLTVSLNTGDNRRIIADGMVNIENALAWGYNRQHRFSLDDCRDSLLFMDGFDEFIDEAKGTNVNDIVTFMKILEGIADEYDIHIIVLSRTIAVKGFLSEPTMKYISYQLMPLTDIEQDSWLESHIEYEDYLPTFKTLRNNGDMRTLLGIPFLFRLIIHSRFNKITSNVVELYSTLTNHLMEKRNIRGAVLGSVIAGLNNLAYKIYCTDTDTTIIKEDERNSHWILAFYIKQSKEGKIGFFHRSFYQYFLARNIYDGIFHVTNDGIENYIGLFAERELDDTVRQYLSLMLLEEDKES